MDRYDWTKEKKGLVFEPMADITALEAAHALNVAFIGRINFEKGMEYIDQHNLWRHFQEAEVVVIDIPTTEPAAAPEPERAPLPDFSPVEVGR